MPTTDAMAGAGQAVSLAEAWAEAFAGVLELMAGARPSWQCAAGAPELGGEPLLGWEQSFTRGPEPAMWAGLPEKAWMEIGRSSLEAAGLPSAGEQEVHATLREMLAQAFSSFAVALGARQGPELAATNGRDRNAAPEGWTTVAIQFHFSEGRAAPVLLSMDSWWWSEHPVNGAVTGPAVSDLQPETASTMDLLLDVELPVSVSFGRTRLPLEELLKLGPGSVIELGRNADDPVELIVNNCVVALGEVVVVDGNYGVRISRIASRAERLRTGATGARSAKSGARA
ncbi:MAG: flagellar motor switch protein FliN [Bryobacterales bacterium]|nr:flagellar motor switch protein FliN [Bryobacteraceae bacterium]MDW8355253.1 flagellar motor switch protein FliN [Bryobacterales bacterium]